MARYKGHQAAEQNIETARLNGDTRLDLKYLQLTSLPESLSALTQLQSLDLSGNQLTSLPESLGALTQLQSLNLHGNHLTSLPESLGALTQLQSLDLSGNQLTSLPESIGALAQLQWLKLSENGLTSLPEGLNTLAQLWLLDLHGNQVTRLPEWFDTLIQLQRLDLGSNQLITLEGLNILTRLQLQFLDLRRNGLTSLPDWVSAMTQLHSLNLSFNQLSSLPESIGALTRLHSLDLSFNELIYLPEEFRALTGLQLLNLLGNRLERLPQWFDSLTSLQSLDIRNNSLVSLPESLGTLKQLPSLKLSGNRLKEIPSSFAQLEHLKDLDLSNNPLNPELAVAYKEGINAVRAYLRAKSETTVALNEAKLILIGEGEVGKSCLLGALRDDPWEEGRPTTHGIEIKSVSVVDIDSGKEIILNGWDFGGQRVYRPTHQLFFSAPAVYLVVWKPREGPQQGFVKEWIKLVKHREPEAKILVVSTHGGPGARQPDIDRQELRDLFGKETVIDFLHVESKPNANGVRLGITDLKRAIARVAVSLPGMGRAVPKRWQDVREALQHSGAAYLPLERVLDLCRRHNIAEEEVALFVTISHQLGHFIHYQHDLALRDIVVLKPDWLAIAISFVLDDEVTRNSHGLVSFTHLGELWNNPARTKAFRYTYDLHPIFRRLMERFDLSYRVAGVSIKDETDEVSLIAQLVPDTRPEKDLAREWPSVLVSGDIQQVQICRIVDAENGQFATAEGLFYQLIVRLHKYSLGRAHYENSVHWQRGLVLDDNYNGRALLEHIGNDIRIIVRAPYPERFLSVLTSEVKYLVDTFWNGLRCDVMVPCVTPCGKKMPGTGLFEVQRLIDSKRQGRLEYPCQVCNEWQDIDILLRNAPSAHPPAVKALFAEFSDVKHALTVIYQKIQQRESNAIKHLDQIKLAQSHKVFLRDSLIKSFDLSELKTLCSDIRVDYDTLIGGGKDEKVRELLAYLERRGRINELILYCSKERPNLAWQAVYQVMPLHHTDTMRWLDHLDENDQRLLSKVDDAYTTLIQALTNEAKEGPRLFSLVPFTRNGFNSRQWTNAKFHLILWCEHSRLPLPLLNTKDKTRGIYELDLTRGWFKRVAPFLSVLTGTLNLVLPVALSGIKLSQNESTYKSLTSYFDFGKEVIDASLDDAQYSWLGAGISTDLENEEVIRAHRAVLREFHALFKSKDPNFGGLVRVNNKRQEFLWVHEQFEQEY